MDGVNPRHGYYRLDCLDRDTVLKRDISTVDSEIGTS